MVRYFLLILSLFIGSVSCDQNRQSKLLEMSNDEWLNPIDSMILAWIPPGKTSLQSSENIEGENHTIQQELNFEKGFWMSKTEVTVEQFQTFVAQTGFITEAEKSQNKFNWKNPGYAQDADHPVVYISSNDVKRYLEWSMSSLPTQEEWIYAAKADASTKYYWGEEFDEKYLWYRMNASAGAKPVGTKLPNNWGLHDMIGNVYEYVSLCDTSYFTMGDSWTRCDQYSSHIPGDTVSLSLGNLKQAKLNDCTIQLRNPWNDDTGFRYVRHVE